MAEEESLLARLGVDPAEDPPETVWSATAAAIADPNTPRVPPDGVPIIDDQGDVDSAETAESIPDVTADETDHGSLDHDSLDHGSQLPGNPEHHDPTVDFAGHDDGADDASDYGV